MFLRKDDFFTWLDEYTKGRRNDLQRSQTAIPKRSEKIILNLGVVPNQPIEINIPFKSVTFVKSTFGSQLKSAQVSVLLDSSNTGNQKNAITLKTGDTLNNDQVISKCFLIWELQPSVQAELVFLEDSQLYTTEGTIEVTNIVQTQGTSTVFQGTSPWSVTIDNQPISVREFPRSTIPFDVPANTTVNFTVPTGEYWIMNVSASNQQHCPGNFISLNSTVIARPEDKGNFFWQWYGLFENDGISITTDINTNGISGFFSCYKVN